MSTERVKPILYVSFDIEADGPHPSTNSMLSMAFVSRVGKFVRNLLPLPNQSPDPSCMTEFWAKQPNAWNEVMKNRVDPEQVFREFSSWFLDLQSKYKVKLIAYPASYDHTFISHYWYYFRAKLNLPEFPYQSKCVSTLLDTISSSMGLNGVQKIEFREKFVTTKHTHLAEDDAIGQLELFEGLTEFMTKLLDPVHDDSISLR